MISPSSSAVPNYIYKQEVQKNNTRMFLILISVLIDPQLSLLMDHVMEKLFKIMQL